MDIIDSGGIDEEVDSMDVMFGAPGRDTMTVDSPVGVVDGPDDVADPVDAWTGWDVGLADALDHTNDDEMVYMF